MQLMENIKKALNKSGVKRSRKSLAAFTAMLTVTALSAVPAFAANADLDTATTILTGGGTDMKLSFLTMIAIVIPIVIVVFGISWLMGLFKRKMNKA